MALAWAVHNPRTETCYSYMSSSINFMFKTKRSPFNQRHTTRKSVLSHARMTLIPWPWTRPWPICSEDIPRQSTYPKITAQRKHRHAFAKLTSILNQWPSYMNLT